MHRIICAIMLCCLSPMWIIAMPGSGKGNSIHWFTSYEEAVAESQKTSKPILMFFTGSDWCGWCTKLEQESLDTPEFAQDAGNNFVFLKLDFPLYSKSNPQLTNQNKQLQKKHNVRSFPTIVILDAQQKQVGVTGYRPGGGKQFAEHLNKMTGDYGAYRSRLSSVGQAEMSGADLKGLYEKARDLHFANDAQQIVRAGIHSDHAQYFLIEKYRFLVEEGQIHDMEATLLRQQLLASDLHNEQGTHYKIALIDFEAYSDEMERENSSPELAIAPLVEYIEKFGSEDITNVWRLQMIISQVFFENDSNDKALHYAQASYYSAPQPAKSEIATFIKNIQALQIK